MYLNHCTPPRTRSPVRPPGTCSQLVSWPQPVVPDEPRKEFRSLRDDQGLKGTFYCAPLEGSDGAAAAGSSHHYLSDLSCRLFQPADPFDQPLQQQQPMRMRESAGSVSLSSRASSSSHHTIPATMLPVCGADRGIDPQLMAWASQFNAFIETVDNRPLNTTK